MEIFDYCLESMCHMIIMYKRKDKKSIYVLCSNHRINKREN